MLRGYAFIIIYSLLICAAIFGAYRDHIDSLLDWSMTGASLLLLLGFIYDARSQGGLLKYLTIAGLLLSTAACLAMVYPDISERLSSVVLLLFFSHTLFSLSFTRVPDRPLEIPNIRKYPWVIFLAIFLAGYTFMELRDSAGKQAWMLILTIIGFSVLTLTAFNRAHAVSASSYRWVFIGAVALLGFDACYLWLTFDSLDSMLSPLRYASLGLGLWGLAYGLSNQINSIED